MKNAILACVLAAVSLLSVPVSAQQGGSASSEDVVVYKSPWCGCCQGWADHMRASGYRVTVREMEDLTSLKRMSGIPEELESCHTAFVGGYAIEGHVPADVIEKLLLQRPAVRGLAVPGMPGGSPGMEGANPEPYDVMTFTKDGATTVYEHITPR